MNSKLYGKLIFELSHEGSKAYSLPKNRYGDYELPSCMRRVADVDLPECDELTVVRHYTNLSGNNFGVDNGFYPLGSCTMKYNPAINEEIAARKEFADRIAAESADGKPSREIYVKLISGDRATYYYYVSFIGEGIDYWALLLDPATGNVVSKK